MEQINETQDWNMVSEVELVYRSKVKASKRPQVKRSRDAYELLLNSWDQNRIEFIEQFKVVFMNRSNRVLGIFEASSGGITGTVADPRVIFIAALKMNASALILSHNHPGGNPEPSNADKVLTEKFKQAGSLLDIKVMEHIILTSETYYSFADEGLL